jgi:hypothetical protein
MLAGMDVIATRMVSLRQRPASPRGGDIARDPQGGVGVHMNARDLKRELHRLQGEVGDERYERDID